MSVTAVQASPPTGREQYRRRLRRDVNDFLEVPLPIHRRHAAPSAPWPWMNFDIDASEVQPVPLGLPDNSEWSQYPQSLFKNWTCEQVNRSQMLTKCSDSEASTIYRIGVFDNGIFDKRVETRIVRKGDAVDLQGCRNYLGIPPSSNTRVQALFAEDMTLPILQMLGTRYNIEPFFFSSSVNWIPSRYREDPRSQEDHITVVLPFIRILKSRRSISRARPFRTPTLTSTESQSVEEPLPYMEEKQIIDTQAPLSLPENKILIQDLLSLHMVRKTTTSTIISYHQSSQGTSAQRLQSLVQRTGDSVYWSKIFKRSKDPTFLFLTILWYALYAWDETFEGLYRYINALEHKVLQSYDMKLTRELHKLQAYLLSYDQLLGDFLRTVEFVRDMPNPAMNASSISKEEREDSAQIMDAETNNLISEIERLTGQREMLFARLANVIRLTLATLTIGESKAMQELAEATVKDSATIKRIAYLSTAFLPATYLANVFSMNVREINPPPANSTVPLNHYETLNHYIEAVIGLTLFTSWLVIAFQTDSSFFPRDSGILHRTLWPLFYAYGAMSKVRGWLEFANRRSPRDTRLSLAFDEGRPVTRSGR